jgi:hypothetical protein
MGKIFTTNTWRAPLQLIDCWLPLPSERPLRPAASSNAAKAVQRFARAGWLNREAANGPVLQSRAPVASLVDPRPACRVRVLRQTENQRAQSRDMRLVISGPIGDVCAELDRLAALEQASLARAA